MYKYSILIFVFLISLFANTIAQTAYITDEASDAVSVINLKTNLLTATIRVGHSPYGVAVSPDGSKVYITNSGSNNVSVIDALTNTVTATIRVGLQPIGITVSPDGNTVYVANGVGNTVTVINSATNAVCATISIGNNPYGIAVSPDGKSVYVASFSSNKISVINTSKNSVTATITVGNNPLGIALNSDGSKVFVTNNGSGTVSVINASNNSLLSTLEVGTSPFGICATPDGKKIFVANFSGKSVTEIDADNASVSSTIPVDSSSRGISVTPDGNTIYVVNEYSNSITHINPFSKTASRKIAVGHFPAAFGNFISAHTPCIASIPSISVNGNTTICPGNSVELSSDLAASYLWSNGSTTQTINVAQSGDFSVIIKDQNGCTGASIPTSITLASPSIPVISANQNVLTSSSTFGNQWMLDNFLISGAINSNLSVHQSGCYSVMVNDNNGCTIRSDLSCISLQNTNAANTFTNAISLFPNPNNGTFTISNLQAGIYELQIKNLMGGLLYSQSINQASSINTLISIPMGNGIYFWELVSGPTITANGKVVVIQ